MRLLLYIGVLLILTTGVAGSFFSWMFGQNSDGNESSDDGGTSTKTSAASLGRVPFEMKSAEQRFLKAGEDYMAGLSVLDTCHHRVIAELETSCNDITEEELGKLGVALLNCQSKSEGRLTYTCTKEMTLAECTKEMDATTWNAYHIISDRSRSVCYGVRQQQFQRQTRFAVNQLAATASDQLNVMHNLREGQDTLQSVATDTLQIMADGQKEVLNKQEILKESQGELQVSIESNLKDLSSEKALIAAGHKELASMTESIRQQLDNATKQLLSQDQDLKRNHEDLQRDLASIRIKAKKVWNKLDGNMKRVAIHQDETFQYYTETLDNLKKMNDTINYLLNLVNDMQTGIDKQLGWLTALVGGVANWFVLLILKYRHNKKLSIDSKSQRQYGCRCEGKNITPRFALPPAVNRSLMGKDVPGINTISCNSKTPMPSSASALEFGDLSHQANPAKRHLASALEELPRATPSPWRQREGTPNSTRPSTPDKRLCNGLTKLGQPCRMASPQGSDFCFLHADTE